jgi:tRNA dimethylallyltransferase
VDPAGYALVDRQNPRRVVRALEVFRQTGVPFSANYQTSDSGLDALWLGLKWPQARLDERIGQRTRAMLDAGFLEEVRALAEKGHGPSLRRLKLIGYPELLEVVEGGLGLEEAVALLERSTRRYARRQLKWFRREKDIQWLDAEHDATAQALAAIREWREKDAEPPGRVSGPA